MRRCNSLHTFSCIRCIESYKSKGLTTLEAHKYFYLEIHLSHDFLELLTPRLNFPIVIFHHNIQIHRHHNIKTKTEKNMNWKN